MEIEISKLIATAFFKKNFVNFHHLLITKTKDL